MKCEGCGLMQKPTGIACGCPNLANLQDRVYVHPGTCNDCGAIITTTEEFTTHLCESCLNEDI